MGVKVMIRTSIRVILYLTNKCQKIDKCFDKGL